MPGPDPHHGLCVWVIGHTGSLGPPPPLPFFEEILLLKTNFVSPTLAFEGLQASFLCMMWLCLTDFHKATRRRKSFVRSHFMSLTPSGD